MTRSRLVTGVTARATASRDRVVGWVEGALAEDHTPHQVALSFAVGTVVVVLPTGGAALVALPLVAHVVDRASKAGLLATLVVFTPPVKWAVYGTALWLGTRLLGPVPGVSTPAPDPLAAGPAVLARYLLGDALLAVGLATVGYAVVRWAMRARGAGRGPTDRGT